jgi:hypothetical protein
MKNSTTPDCLPTSFYKVFWEQIKESILEMLDQFHRGELNLSRLNYDLISLTPKMKKANNIKQYKLICLLGIDYKWFTKVLSRSLTKVAESTITKTEITFIPRRNIFVGV